MSATPSPSEDVASDTETDTATDTATLGLRDQRKLALREAIVDAAVRLFDERGMDSTSVDDIADAVDISRATFFNHFTYKEALLVEIGARFVDGIAAQASARRRRSARKALYDLADAVAGIATQHPELVAYIAREMTHPDTARRQHALERMGYPRLYEALLDDLERDGRLKRPSRRRSYARQLVDLTTGTLIRAGNDLPLSELAKELRSNVDLFWEGAVRPSQARS